MTLVTDPSPPPKTFMTWLGRQVAHIRHALHTDVSEPKQEIVYRQLETREQPHPEHPNVTLRRTTIDEVILNKEEQALNDPGQS